MKVKKSHGLSRPVFLALKRKNALKGSCGEKQVINDTKVNIDDSEFENYSHREGKI
jgi:hypothetical protein